MARKNYPDTQKLEILKILELNDFNFNRTEKQTGINRVTIKRWLETPRLKLARKKVGKTQPEERLQKSATEIEINTQEKKTAIIDKAFMAHEEAMDRIRNLIPKEKNLKNLADLIKILGTTTLGEESESDDPKSLNFFQQINQMLIQQGDEKSEN